MDDDYEGYSRPGLDAAADYEEFQRRVTGRKRSDFLAPVVVEKTDGADKADIAQLDTHDFYTPAHSSFVAGFCKMSAELGSAYLIECGGHDGLSYLCHRGVLYRVLDTLDLKDGPLYVLDASCYNTGHDYGSAIAGSQRLRVKIVRTRNDIVCVRAFS